MSIVSRASLDDRDITGEKLSAWSDDPWIGENLINDQHLALYDDVITIPTFKIK